ncbi:hypothetical protein [Sphingobium yanoikuyae]|uniref:hypothetical protein n=1 Tax=Sphingobium yanoikuyae TaxID=13690 RepID=UPI0019179D07|nr:hypothetical protein [Sphingobium yanoikuyae]
MSSSLAADPAFPLRKSGLATPGSWLTLAALWALCAAVMLFQFRAEIAQMMFMDTDDAMRLQQVRDWIGGQGWFDVSQHRINPPIGGPMHWSRLVDLPIATIILLARPLIGQHAAEILACATVPLLTLAALVAALFRAARLMTTERLALLSVALLLVTPTILIQFTPTRIDHHGWQILMATIALGGALDPRRVRGGALAGLALAIWLQISTEGLPYAALFGGLFVLRHAIDMTESPRLTSFAAMLGMAALGLLVATHGGGALAQTQCDALSAVYAWPLALFALIIVAGSRLSQGRTFLRRLLIPAIGGMAALAASLWIGADCLTAGPFHELTPLAYQQWYMRVMEGRPVWEQTLPLAGVSLLPALVGLTATIAAAWNARDGQSRTNWLVIAILLFGATGVAAMVLRAMSVAHVFALPGIAWLLATLFQRIQKLDAAAARVLLSVLLALLTPVGTASAWASLAETADRTLPIKKENCRTPSALAPLDALPPSLLFAPLDIGPDILVHTHHSVIGTGHHRNVIGINAVTHAFLASPDAARADVMAAKAGHGADYLVMCARMNEMLLYAQSEPKGLAAQLSRGNVPDWLQPLPTKGPLRIYKVRRD